jgi:hypothetical protein
VGVAGTCPHGFSEGTCLICSTLNGPQAGSKTTRTAVAPVPGAAESGSRRKRSASLVQAPLNQTPKVAGQRRTARGLAFRAMAIVALVILVAIVAWAALGFVFAILHIVELALVAALFAWMGYRVGHHRGRHERQGS